MPRNKGVHVDMKARGAEALHFVFSSALPLKPFIVVAFESLLLLILSDLLHLLQHASFEVIFVAPDTLLDVVSCFFVHEIQIK